MQGASADNIRDLTGCPRQSIQRYIEDFEAGRSAEDFSSYFGIDLSPQALCRLTGTWYAKMSQPLLPPNENPGT